MKKLQQSCTTDIKETEWQPSTIITSTKSTDRIYFKSRFERNFCKQWNLWVNVKQIIKLS